MDLLKVLNIDNGRLEFENGYILEDYHSQDCCESHYLSFDNLSNDDFLGLYFDLSNDDFLERVEGSGIRIKPVNGHPIFIPGYGSNNGKYSYNLLLIISKDNKEIRRIGFNF